MTARGDGRRTAKAGPRTDDGAYLPRGSAAPRELADLPAGQTGERPAPCGCNPRASGRAAVRPASPRACATALSLPYHGAGTAQLVIAAGVLDEVELHSSRCSSAKGAVLFEGLAPEQIELERTGILEGENEVTHVHHPDSAMRSAFPRLLLPGAWRVPARWVRP
jgi:hypothetical protein